MDFSGTFTIPASREAVWTGLNDADVLRDCIDGCESLEWTSESDLRAYIKVRLGPVSAKFVAMITLSDVVPQDRYVLSGQGQGGAAGFVRGQAQVTLSGPEEGPTTLHCDSTATVGGRLASVGSRLMQGAVDKAAEDFFGAFADRIGASSEAVTGTVTATAMETETETVAVTAAETVAETVTETEGTPAPAAAAPPPHPQPQPPGLATPQPLAPAPVPPLTEPPRVLLPLTVGTIAAAVAGLAVLVALLIGLLMLLF